MGDPDIKLHQSSSFFRDVGTVKSNLQGILEKPAAPLHAVTGLVPFSDECVSSCNRKGKVLMLKCSIKYSSTCNQQLHTNTLTCSHTVVGSPADEVCTQTHTYKEQHSEVTGEVHSNGAPLCSAMIMKWRSGAL